MKRVIRVRSTGMIYIFMTIIMGVLAVNGGNNLHYLATALLLGYMSASGVAGRSNLMGVDVSLSFPDEIYAGAPFLLTVDVTNTRRRVPVFLIDVKVGGTNLFFPVIQPGECKSGSVVFSFPSRGYNFVGEIEVSSVYPFNFFKRYKQMDQESGMIVFPRKASLHEEAMFVDTDDPSVQPAAIQPPQEADIVGVRPYSEGDPMKHVHWKSSARTGRLNTKLYDGSPDDGGHKSGGIIDLDGLEQYGLERALSIASREISDSLRSGAAIGVASGGTLRQPAGSKSDKLSMLAWLALYEKKHIS
ncbi:MAG: DUF58 domain-containing protein [Synergistaceae bacterium]|jgi:uncharacterized protein (DUF58 family)|nr:DUF58 domain-containing protein [Synergistaceae bacterium]